MLHVCTQLWVLPKLPCDSRSSRHSSVSGSTGDRQCQDSGGKNDDASSARCLSSFTGLRKNVWI